MQRFKTRLRLLTEKLGGSLAFEDDGSLVISVSANRIHFEARSRDEMRCDISQASDRFIISAPKTHCFDIVLRMAAAHLALNLKHCAPNLLVEMREYLRDERAGDQIAEFKRQVAADPTITFAELGGNRWIAEYYYGYLILTDDLCLGAANMVEL